MARGLCENCLHGFDESDLAPLGGRRVCRECRGRIEGAAMSHTRPVPLTTGRFLLRLRDRLEAWCAGRSWAVRLPLLLWFAYILVRHWADPEYQSLFGPLNLGIHELGHFVFGWLGTFLGMAGGTVLQCLAPVLSMAMFFRQPDFFAVAVCLGWLSTNFFNVARYAEDARAMALTLVRPGGGEVVHDWNYLLEATGLLERDRAIGFLFRAAGSVSMLAALAAGGWLLWKMSRSRAGSGSSS